MAERKNIDCEGHDIQCPLDATIHWCLMFNQPLSQISIEDDTPCTLLGLILWQNLSIFLEAHYQGFADKEIVRESIGDEFPLVQSGIPCTVGELCKGMVTARLTFEFSLEKDTRKILRDVSWHEIVEMPLKQFLEGIKKKIRYKTMKDTDLVSLAGFAKESGYIGQRSPKYKIALAAASCLPLHEVPHNQIYNHLIREEMKKKEYINPGSLARVSLCNGVGDVVSSRTMVI